MSQEFLSQGVGSYTSVFTAFASPPLSSTLKSLGESHGIHNHLSWQLTTASSSKLCVTTRGPLRGPLGLVTCGLATGGKLKGCWL